MTFRSREQERGEGGESHTTYAYKYISECIFLNFESVLNYTRTHTQRRCTLPLPLPRPRLCWRVETRISSMFNPKHKTEKPNRQKHNQIEPKPRQASTRRTAPHLPHPSPPSTPSPPSPSQSRSCSCSGPGTGLKVFHRKSSETKPKQQYVLHISVAASLSPSPSLPLPLSLALCVRNRNPKN